MANFLTDKQIADNARKQLSEVKKEIEEVYELHYEWKPKKDWHNALNKLKTKQYLIQEILGEDE